MSGASSCAVCGELPASVRADLAKGEKLPEAAGALASLAGGKVRRCRACGAWFLYEYDYEYGAIGDGWETASLERAPLERVCDVLLAASPSEVGAALRELGIAEGELAIEDRLEADLTDEKRSYDAVRTLVQVYLERSDAAAVERLLRHARSKVRADTLYVLQTYRGALWFKAVRAATDPSPDVRAAAMQRATAPTSEHALGPAIIACLEDPDPKVRNNAAWALAVYAERGDDIRDALPALAAVLLIDRDADARTTAARAVIGAAASGADASGVLGVVELLPESDPLRARVLDAIRTELARTKRVYAYRCPTCGSTNAGPDESRSMYEFTFMQCNGCGDGHLVDSWQRDEDWIVAVDLPVHNPELPSHLPPLGPGESFVEQLQAVRDSSTSTAPAPDPPIAPPAPSMPAPAPPPRSKLELRARRVPPGGYLSTEEVAQLFAMGVPIEETCVPDAVLQQALAERRVQVAMSASSMGTAETFWAAAAHDEDIDFVRDRSVVVPPGHAVEVTPTEEWADDRDIVGVLWRPFWDKQRAAVVAAVPKAQHEALIAEYALLLADLEERWAEGPKLDSRRTLLDALRTNEPIDVDALLRTETRRSVRHLVRGVRALWITHDLDAAYAAVVESAERFRNDDTLRATRMELLRAVARAASASLSPR